MVDSVVVVVGVDSDVGQVGKGEYTSSVAKLITASTERELGNQERKHTLGSVFCVEDDARSGWVDLDARRGRVSRRSRKTTTQMGRVDEV